MREEVTPLIIIPIGIFIGSIALTFVAIALDSWKLVWLGALTSLFLSIIAGFSIGPFLFLLTCLQLGSALALRWQLHGFRMFGLLVLLVAIWIVVVPFQVFVFNLISLLGDMLLVTVVAALATIWTPDTRVGSRTG